MTLKCSRLQSLDWEAGTQETCQRTGLYTVITWRKKKRNGERVGIELRDDGVAIVHSDIGDYGHRLHHVDFLPCGMKSSNLDVIGGYVKQHGLEKLPCNIVLPQGQYQLLLIESPEVPDSEMRSALRWKVKDLINIPLEDAAIEYFRLPDDGINARKKMVYVVITELSRLRDIVQLMKNVDLQLKTIDINELAVRNLSSKLLDPKFEGRGVAIARLRQGRGSVGLFKKGNLYLSRQFDLDYQAGLLEDLPDDILALELQRSLDYYERQMGQAPPGVVYVCGDGVAEDKITASLQSALAFSIQFLDVGAICSVPDDADFATLQQCLGAVGAAMREEKLSHAAN